MFCQGIDDSLAGHTRQQCPVFKALKRDTSPEPYIAATLKERDEAGYAAAGVLPWRRSDSGGIEMLLAREYRSPSLERGGDRLNFLGGKRLLKDTDALTCAVDKVYNETGGQLSYMRDGCPLVCWSNQSKYVLFVFELVGGDDREVDVRCAGLGKDGVKRLEWATRSELLNQRWVGQHMHQFAAEILQQLITCNVMNHLEALFDVAVAVPSSSSSDTATREGLTVEESDLHFDLVGAMRSILAVARPDLPTLPTPPSYLKLRSAVSNIPKIDMRKLKLRFHPDRLVRVLQRDPSDEEIAMSTVAMQTLNGLVDAAGSEQDVMANIKKLDQLRRTALRDGGSGSVKSSNAVEDLLSRLSL
jgi:8-oxo-dGTP pyrophosphatase MutT (NUDIX family)